MQGLRVGQQVVVDVGPVAHGGHCVARHEGQVIFVRHALPAETVEVVVTALGTGARFVHADAVRVLTPSPDRVEPPCPHSGPGRCGGCDWQHVDLAAQRRLKAAVLTEALTRLGGLTELDGVPLASAVTVQAVAGDDAGLGWRTRVTYAVASDGRLGLRRHRSHEVELLTLCRIAHPAVGDTDVTARTWDGYDSVAVVAASSGERQVRPEPATPTGDRHARAVALQGLPPDVSVPGLRGRSWVREVAAGRQWRVDGAGFWQVHPGAADVLVDTVRELLAPRPGDHLLDLYSGVGLFGGSLAEDLGPTGRIDCVESSPGAVRCARRNLHDLPQVHLHEALVERWLGVPQRNRVDLVVLDPPRKGAGARALRRILELRPRAVAYVACDPASLARDVGTAVGLGWSLARVVAFDLFPMTAHLETVALLLPPEEAPNLGSHPGNE
ncbi:MAG: TRAM domain-containing protein [Candidatus Nanopelagicales bacterium]